MNDSISEVLNFWFSDESAKKWFKSTDAFDAEIKQGFESLWITASNGEFEEWTNTSNGSLALCILLDQFPLNMFRGNKKSFQTESHSIKVAKKAIEQGFDEEIEKERVSFLYMPLMHSENLDDQELCIRCFEKQNLQDNLRFAKHHRDIILEFERFPHRNEILGRESSPAEIEYLLSKRAFKG